MYRVSVQSTPLAPFGSRSLVPLFLSRRVTIPLAMRQVPFYIDIQDTTSGTVTSSTEATKKENTRGPSASLARLDQCVGLQGPLSMNSSSRLFSWQEEQAEGDMRNHADDGTEEEFSFTGATSIARLLSQENGKDSSHTSSTTLIQREQLRSQLDHHTSLLLSALDTVFSLLFDSPDEIKTVVLAHKRLLDAVQDLDTWLGINDHLSRLVASQHELGLHTAGSLVPVLHMAQQHFGLAMGPYPHAATLLRECCATASIFETTKENQGATTRAAAAAATDGASSGNLLSPKSAFQAVLDIEGKIPTVAEHKAKTQPMCPYGGVLTSVGEVIKVHHTMDPRETVLHHQEGSREREALKRHRHQSRMGFQGSVSTVSWNSKTKPLAKQFGYNSSAFMSNKAKPRVDRYGKKF